MGEGEKGKEENRRDKSGECKVERRMVGYKWYLARGRENNIANNCSKCSSLKKKRERKKIVGKEKKRRKGRKERGVLGALVCCCPPYFQ